MDALQVTGSANVTAGATIGGDLTVYGALRPAKAVLPAAADAPEAGMIYFNATGGHFYGYDGSAWKQLDN